MRVLFKYSKRHLCRKGFTLSEILLSVGLMAFVAVAAIGGLVVLNNARDRINKQNQAEMIMIATVGYLRKDLNSCADPHTMNCSNTYYPMMNANAMSSDFFHLDFSNLPTSEWRYINIIIRDSSNETIATTTAYSPKVQYWNSTNQKTNESFYGICVGVIFEGDVVPPGIPELAFKPSDYKKRKFIIAQNIMQGTGMFSLIGDGTLDVGEKYEKGLMTEAIVWDNTNKLFTFWVYVIDENSKEIIMKQYVEVCPDTLLPYTNTSNP